MVAKTILLFCAQALFAQYISSQYIRGYDGMVGPFPGPRNGPCVAEAPGPIGPVIEVFRPSNGGGFAITSVSPMAVTGLTMKSDNVYEGPLAVTGAVPFLGAVGLEGALPTAGAGAVSYGCGNGNVAMVSEDIASYPGPYAYGEMGYGYAPMAYEAGFAGPGCGCNRGFAGPFY